MGAVGLASVGVLCSTGQESSRVSNRPDKAPHGTYNLLVNLHASVVYLRLLTLLLGGLDNALVSLCVWNAVSKCHAPDMALSMFEGLLLFGFIWFHFI
jgi:hypothetical protein